MDIHKVKPNTGMIYATAGLRSEYKEEANFNLKIFLTANVSPRRARIKIKPADSLLVNVIPIR